LKREQLEAIINLGIACDRIQAAHYGMANDVMVSDAIVIQKLILTLTDSLKKAAGFKEEQVKVFLPAFPKSTQKHIKPKISYRHHVQR